MRKLYSLLAVVMILFGCSSNDGSKSVSRFEELKTLPADSVLSMAYKFYNRFRTTNDSTLLDSVSDYRGHFFARWKRTTDSICDGISMNGFLATELREMYYIVMEYEIKRKYDSVVRNKEKRQDTNLRKNSEKGINGLKNVTELLKKWNENPDSMRAAMNLADSIRAAGIMAISLDEAVAGLKNNHESFYFVQSLPVAYVDTAISSMTDFDEIKIFSINKWKKAYSSCLEKTPMGQQVLVLNKEYESLLNNFMKTNIHEDRRERYTFRTEKYPFWNSLIPVVPHHWGDDFHFNSFPVINNVVFNKTHDMAMLDVMVGFSNGNYYYLSKRSGKWKLVKCKDGWVS